jgi:hypothetical protein
MTRSQVLGACALVVAASSPAAADVGKAWSAAKDNLPASTDVVLAIDVAKGVAMPSFGKLVAAAIKQEHDVGEGLDAIKRLCNIDAPKVIDGVVIALASQAKEGLVLVQFRNTDRAALESCVLGVMKTFEPAAAIKAAGNLSVIEAGPHDRMYFAWLSPDVVAISLEPEKQAHLARWIGQKGAFAKSPAATQLAKTAPSGTNWGVFDVGQPVDSDFPVQHGAGSLAIAGDKGTLTLRGTTADAATASAAVTRMRKEVDEEVRRKRNPPALKQLFRGIVVKAIGADIQITASASLKDIAAIIPQM